MKKLLILAITLLTSSKLHGYEFKWNLNTNEILRIKSLVKQNIFTNSSFYKYVEILNKASMDVKSVSYSQNSKYYGVEGYFYVFTKDYLKDKEFKLEEVHTSKYILEENGKMTISKNYLMPVARDIPTFIKKDIKPQDEWNYKGKEVHKIGFSEIFDIVEVEFNVNYKLVEITNIESKDIGIFEIKYAFANTFKNTKIIDYLSGSSDIKYYWDISEGKPYFMTENYFFNAIYKNGLSIVFSGKSESYLEVVKKLDEKNRKEVISKLNDTLTNIKNIETSTKDNEINISIPDIIFEFNSFKVKEEFISILSNLAIKIKDYKELDIIVEGHTDDIGSEEYNQKLSENRAKEVSSILIKFGIDPKKISYIGYGKNKPKVPNTSEENRAKNRRVEIKLMWGR